MASFVRNNPINNDNFRIDTPQNSSSPIRIAFLGDCKTGKTSIISKLSQGVLTDTYYPTIRTNSNLLTFFPESPQSLKVLDPSFKDFTSIDDNLNLSPVLKRIASKGNKIFKRKRTASDSTGTEIIVHSKNDYYRSYNYKKEIGKASSPHVTPIFVELIDTPPFKSDVVPFLESSLYTNLDKDILKNLANEPRRDVSTMPLLVASGAGDLNSLIDGYFFVYSAVPSYQPPSYEESSSVNSTNDPDSLQTIIRLKHSLDDAWKEFYTFKKNWEQGKEADIYSIKDALKNVFFNKSISEVESDKLSKRKFYKDLLELPKDPANPNSAPPIWIICTHVKSHLASPILIEEGKKYAKKWDYGFIGIDITEDLDVVISLMIREIVERKILQKLDRK
ncbi:uncharacterized protein CLIB1444_02S01508 [[Candida] jaroonii]|uniref:Uncharacterized protein n=1 Tax=[Candida] jaroonii TaxID=467808 RepID=A0ACA9Y2S5_9ASCO|nr:uncharacterized protein CLIB1444_02S01508 [[Candida] jaroonii]